MEGTLFNGAKVRTATGDKVTVTTDLGAVLTGVISAKGVGAMVVSGIKVEYDEIVSVVIVEAA